MLIFMRIRGHVVSFVMLLVGLLASPLKVQANVPAHLEPLRREIEVTALRYFLDHAHPVTGLVRDKANAFGATPASNVVASIAATGFGLAVVANASEQGFVSRNDGEAYSLRVLRYTEKRLVRHKGWFFHFVDWSNGSRAWKSEVSTIDTALFLAGALYAGEIFGGETKAIAERLYAAVDFHEFMTDGGKNPAKRTLSLSYTPEKGFVPYQWEVYSEQMILLILGLGHPTRPLPDESWDAWRRHYLPPPWQQVMGVEMPLFIHQYSQAFVDFRAYSDGYPSYFENSVQATQLHRAMAKIDARYETLRRG
ncbi:MAG: glucoamylase family protein, partial [Bdellovibrionota bacterium]